MNILYVAPYLPIPDSHGCGAKTWDDLSELSVRHTFHVVCFVSESDKPKVALLNAVRNICVYPVFIDSYMHRPGRSEQMSGIIKDLCDRGAADILQCECSFMARYVPKGLSLPAIMTEHQVYWLHFLREWKIRKNPVVLVRLLKNIYEEKKWLPRFRRIIFFSDHDRNRFRFLLDDAGKTRSIPLSIDTTKYAPLPEAHIKYDLCFVGNFDNDANVDAVRYYCNEILPLFKKTLPHVSTLIVGANFPDLLKRAVGPDVTCTGYVADVREHIASCKIVINPMRCGSGMRRKILEAWAMAKPVISTAIGAEGLHAINGGNIVFADSPRELASAIQALLADKARMSALGRGGRDTVMRFHERGITAAAIEQLYHEVAGR
jgi:polysaccharide biosynthesis protein PslH